MDTGTDKDREGRQTPNRQRHREAVASRRLQPAPRFDPVWKWHDLDGDHKWDSGEPTLSGWTIYLEMQEENGSDWLPMGSTTTDANGRYSFTGLAEGHYRVYEVVPPGWEQTFPTNNAGMHNLVISNGHPSWEEQDFGNRGLVTPTPTTPTTTATTVTPTATVTESPCPGVTGTRPRPPRRPRRDDRRPTPRRRRSNRHHEGHHRR